MDNQRGPAVEEQERLEQFLAWRQATGRQPRSRRPRARLGLGWRWFACSLGVGVLGAVFVALSALLNGDLRQAQQRLAAPPGPVSTESAAADSRIADLPSTPSDPPRAPDASPSASPKDPSASGPTLKAANDRTEDAGPPAAAPGPTPAPVPTVARVAPSLPDPELSLPERSSRAERRAASSAGSIGEPVAPSPRRSLSARLPALDYRLEVPEVAAATPSPSPAATDPPSSATAQPATSPVAPRPSEDRRSDSRPESSSPAEPPRSAASEATASIASPLFTTAPGSTPSASPEPPARSETTAPSSAPSPAPRQSSAITPQGEPAAKSLPADNATASAGVSSAPAVTEVTRPAASPVPPPEVAVKQLPEPIETLKQFIESIPNGKVGRSILRWVKPDREAESSRSTRDR
jgi:hypothetical protein